MLLMDMFYLHLTTYSEETFFSKILTCIWFHLDRKRTGLKCNTIVENLCRTIQRYVSTSKLVMYLLSRSTSAAWKNPNDRVLFCLLRSLLTSQVPVWCCSYAEIVCNVNDIMLVSSSWKTDIH